MAYVEITPRMLAQLMRETGQVFKVVSGLPADAQYVSMATNSSDCGWVFKCLFRSESFKPVKDGEPWPRLGPVEVKAYAAGLGIEDAEYLRELAEKLDAAHRLTPFDFGRYGTNSDDPEGDVCIQLSDTLAREISARLRRILNNGNA